MKKFRFALCAILLITLIGCVKNQHEHGELTRPPLDKIGESLKRLPGVHSVQELESGSYKKHYLILFKQLLDPKNPAAGTLLQRVFLSHQDFDNPVVFKTEGYDAQQSMTKTHQCELIKRYKANRVEVEHRYSGLSSPSSRGWKYLTCENAAADLHAVYKSLSTWYTSSWIASGVSKGGTNAMSYIMYHPTDMTAAVAYVGPICNTTQDPRFATHLESVATPVMRQKIVDFQRQLLIRRELIQPIYFPTPAQPTWAKEYMTNDQLYENIVADISNIFWQVGWDIDGLPAADATHKEIVDYLDKFMLFGPHPSSTPRITNMLHTPRATDLSRTSISAYLLELKRHSSRADTEPDLSSPTILCRH